MITAEYSLAAAIDFITRGAIQVMDWFPPPRVQVDVAAMETETPASEQVRAKLTPLSLREPVQSRKAPPFEGFLVSVPPTLAIGSDLNLSKCASPILLPASFQPTWKVHKPLSTNADLMVALGPLLLQNIYLLIFIFVFLFRYYRVVRNILAYNQYRPTPIPVNPSYRPRDVSVIIPTTGFKDEVFQDVVRSILAHNIAALIISTGGPNALHERLSFQKLFLDTRISYCHQDTPNRRHQTHLALKKIQTSLMIISDDHTFWPSTGKFVPSLIAPFEDAKIGAVGPVLEVIHHHHEQFSWRAFWNFMGMTYLLRRAHEFLATNTIDGGLSTLASRFAVFRTSIYGDDRFLKAYLNEYIFWGRIGPLNADDDKFHTRWLANEGWKIKIQGGPDTTMTTELGEWPKFGSQCLRWNRTTWRSNLRALVTERSYWTRYPYTTYSILVYSLVRLSFFYEIAMALLLKRALIEQGREAWFQIAAWSLFVWCTVMKFIKVAPHFMKFPKDLVFFPAYIVFGWCMSFVKVWALFTCGETFWATAATPKASIEPGNQWKQLLIFGFRRLTGLI
jgi:hypothetical protein